MWYANKVVLDGNLKNEMFILKGIDIDIDYLASISNKTKQNTKAKTRTKHLKRGKEIEPKFF